MLHPLPIHVLVVFASLTELLQHSTYRSTPPKGVHRRADDANRARIA